MEKGSKELLGISHIVPLPHVMHKGEMSPVPVIVNVWKEPGFLMQSNKKKCGSHLSIIPELPPQLLQMVIRNAVPVFA